MFLSGDVSESQITNSLSHLTMLWNEINFFWSWNKANYLRFAAPEHLKQTKLVEDTTKSRISLIQYLLMLDTFIVPFDIYGEKFSQSSFTYSSHHCQQHTTLKYIARDKWLYGSLLSFPFLFSTKFVGFLNSNRLLSQWIFGDLILYYLLSPFPLLKELHQHHYYFSMFIMPILRLVH